VGPTILRSSEPDGAVSLRRIRSFAPIAAPDARVLVLGSMPGRASLDAGRYYAHRQNAFWRILGALLGFEPSAPYAARARALKAARIALWDVLHSCERAGSLDSSIEAEIANDFERFFRAHPRLTHVFFNGAKAEASYRRHVLPGLGARLRYARLPSTSPAHAALPYPRKLAAWRVILGAVRIEGRSRK
jgi:TDG/mug DNA glycosylase family protein